MSTTSSASAYRYVVTVTARRTNNRPCSETYTLASAGPFACDAICLC
jgi:hypothetical protein